MNIISMLFILAFTPKAPSSVYLCNSDQARRYHLNPKCQGLSTCQYKIIAVSLEKAKKAGKTLCRWETQTR